MPASPPHPHIPQHIGAWPSDRSIAQILAAPGPQTLQQLRRRGDTVDDLHERLRPPCWRWEELKN